MFTPYLKNTNKIHKKIIEFLKQKKLKKTEKYIEKFYEKKEHCSIAFQSIIFIPGIHTTSKSRINHVIKKYPKSKSELFDIIDFITNYQEANTYNV